MPADYALWFGTKTKQKTINGIFFILFFKNLFIFFKFIFLNLFIFDRLKQDRQFRITIKTPYKGSMGHNLFILILFLIHTGIGSITLNWPWDVMDWKNGSMKLRIQLLWSNPNQTDPKLNIVKTLHMCIEWIESSLRSWLSNKNCEQPNTQKSSFLTSAIVQIVKSSFGGCISHMRSEKVTIVWVINGQLLWI